MTLIRNLHEKLYFLLFKEYFRSITNWDHTIDKCSILWIVIRVGVGHLFFWLNINSMIVVTFSMIYELSSAQSKPVSWKNNIKLQNIATLSKLLNTSAALRYSERFLNQQNLVSCETTIRKPDNTYINRMKELIKLRTFDVFTEWWHLKWDWLLKLFKVSYIFTSILWESCCLCTGFCTFCC